MNKEELIQVAQSLEMAMQTIDDLHAIILMIFSQGFVFETQQQTEEVKVMMDSVSQLLAGMNEGSDGIRKH